MADNGAGRRFVLLQQGGERLNADDFSLHDLSSFGDKIR
jgi:hypothetical protein